MYNPLMQTLRDLPKRGRAREYSVVASTSSISASRHGTRRLLPAHRYVFEAIFGTELADSVRLRQPHAHAVEMIPRYLRRN